MSEEIQWNDLVSVSDLEPGHGKYVKHGDLDLAVYMSRETEEAFVFEDACPHQGAPLSSQGLFNSEKREIACGWHGWRYDLDKGISTNVPGFRLAVYESRIVDGMVQLGPKKSPLGASIVKKEAPKAATASDKGILDQVLDVVESDIRPGVKMDGGDIEVVAVDEGVVKVRLHGACTTCSSSSITLYQGVQNILAQKVEGVASVEQVF